METIYLYCAVIGGSLLVLQTLLLVVAGDGGHHDPGDFDLDTDAGHASDVFVKVLSIKTVVAFLTFFGLTGLACTTAQISPTGTVFLALGAGTAALYLVGYLMAMLSKLQSRGNLDLTNAVGQNAKVYLRIPKERTGAGRITISVQGRRIECRAVTAGTEIPTGAEVVVIACGSNGTLEVEPVATA